VKVAELETILSTDDVSERAQLRCLSCRRRLAEATVSDHFTSEGHSRLTVSIAHLSADLRDFQQSQSSVCLTCGCATRSIYHLI
jgi:hypothetical protein